MQRWENMQDFYSCTNLWPAHNQPSPLANGESPLVWTMLTYSPAATRLQTYAWIENWEHPLPGKDGIIDDATATTHLLSQAKREKRKKSAGYMQQGRPDNPHCHTSQTHARAPPRNCSSSVKPKIYPESAAAQRQWENMRKFHSSVHLWPSTELINSAWTEGGSPLIWSMLHPPADSERLTTYAWDGHLDNFLPWTQGQTNHVTGQPPLISYAKWNIQKGPDLQAPQDGANNPHTHFSLQEHHEPPAKPKQTPDTDLLQQQKKYTTSAQSTKGQQDHQIRFTPILSIAQNRVSASPGNLQAGKNTDTVDAAS